MGANGVLLPRTNRQNLEKLKMARARLAPGCANV
jgi:hypothetical protein